MQSQIDSYSRLVAWAKIVLPIIAIGLLSTLFLLSRSVDPLATLPFSQSDLEERTRNQQISSPEVYGVTERGDYIALRSKFARAAEANSNAMEAENVTAQIKLVSGTIVKLASSEALYDAEAAAVGLSGYVSAETSTGYSFTATGFDVNMKTLDASSRGAVKGRGPEGEIDAGQMQITVPQGEKDAHILLTGGVKLLYTAKQNTVESSPAPDVPEQDKDE